MLKNELYFIQEFLSRPIDDRQTLSSLLSESVIKQVKSSWEAAVLSQLPEHTLVRYFNSQLDLLVKISNHLYISNRDDFNSHPLELNLGLIDYLNLYYSYHFNTLGDAGIPFHIRLINQLSPAIIAVRNNLLTSTIDCSLKIVLSKWLVDISDTGIGCGYSFQSCFYLRRLVHQLEGIDFLSEDVANRLINLLISENFNLLSFFVFLQKWYRPDGQNITDLPSKLASLRQTKQAVLSRPEAVDIIYDRKWPSLKTMLSDWLQEEIALTEYAIDDALKASDFVYQKFTADLPVTHMAYLTRLFLEESNSGVQNLKQVFKFYADHFQTKRQPVISPGGFSKAYYSTDQQTAARVMALLQKMTARIKRDFFLAVVAISITVHFYPGMH